MRTNAAVRTTARTHEGAPAMAHQPAELELLRAVGSCLLFENTFYEKGSDIAARIAVLSQKVKADFLPQLAVHARSRLNLRHVALWLAVQNLRRADGIEKAETITRVIQRADELAEILSLYWLQNPASAAPKNKPLAAALKRGIAAAFGKFNEYQLAKYNRDNAVKLRDALFLSHAKPVDKKQAKLWTKLIDGKLAVPDTWEVSLSAGKDKKKTFERLIAERKIGYLALLRNLRNMEQAAVDRKLVCEALINGAQHSRALPFQFVAAWRFAPAFASAIDAAMIQALGSAERLQGSTSIVIDVSGSMDAALSAKSQINRIDAASAMAVLAREICDDVRVFTFSDQAVEIPAARGLALVDVIHRSQAHLSTQLGAAVNAIAGHVKQCDRMIVITDEQSHDRLPSLTGIRGYLVNVASYRPALPAEQAGWTRINGFSERLIDFVKWDEAISQDQTPAAILR